MKLKYLITAMVCSVLFSCGGGNTTGTVIPPDDGYEAPEPPAEVNGYNLFTIDFWSRLADGTLLEGGASYADITAHIGGESAIGVFILDRIDMVFGEPSPLVDIAVQTRCVPFFAPDSADAYTSQGTGFITQEVLNDFPGSVRDDGLIVSGCTVSFPLNQNRDISVMTCRITSADQFASAAGGGEAAGENPVIIVGALAAGLEEGFRDWLKYNRTDFRISVTPAQGEGNAFRLFILTPVYIVVRSVLQTSSGRIPLYRCRLEYLD